MLGSLIFSFRRFGWPGGRGNPASALCVRLAAAWA
jgi:hypothetical protein